MHGAVVVPQFVEDGGGGGGGGGSRLVEVGQWDEKTSDVDGGSVEN